MTVSNPNQGIATSIDRFARLNIGGDLEKLGAAIRNLTRAVPYEAIVRLGEMVDHLDVNAEKIAEIAKSLTARVDQVKSLTGFTMPYSFGPALDALQEFSEKSVNFASANPSARENLDIPVRACWDSFFDSARSTWPA